MKAGVSAPDPWVIVRDAFIEAPRRIARDNFVNYLLLAIFSVIDGANMRNYTYDELINNPFPLTGILGLPAFYFTLAAALRLRNPKYAMRLTQAFRLFVTNLLVFLITLAGALLFIIPGIWAGTRVSLAPYIFALQDEAASIGAAEAVRESWRLTEGRFWQTVALFLWMILLLALPLTALYAAAMAAFLSAHVSAYFFAPFLLFASVFCVQVSNLALLEWTARLAQLPDLRTATDEDVPVPASPQPDED